MPFIILVILIALVLLVSYICAQMVFAGDHSSQDDIHLPPGKQYLEIKDRIFALIDESAALPYEEVWHQNDGLRLHGRLYLQKEKAPIHILMHGYRSDALLDFSGAIRDAVINGHNVLLVTQRAHGKSDGKYLSFGIKESRDCLAWIEYINQRFGAEQPIILKGVSMGAATVMMASELELPENVVGILADCGYSSPEKIIRHVMRKRHYPQLLFPFIRLGGLIFGGFDICSNTPVRALKNCKLPVFFIHGDDDRFVPYEMGLENYDACPTKKFFFTGKNAGHGLSYIVDLEGYRKVYKEFLDEVL
ncbi:MAG: alpha/beta hydrolase [Oscillospiraceae bacterium]|nr:alpha/beta hydrolase [Oscillospiraceae bacterium]